MRLLRLAAKPIQPIIIIIIIIIVIIDNTHKHRHAQVSEQNILQETQLQVVLIRSYTVT